MNLARFDLVSIRLAVACAQTGSLTAAARDSHLALAAASRRIRELEGALGDALFERHARGLLPTAAGRVFVKHGLTLLQTMEHLGGELDDLRQGIARHIRLCASSAAISQFLPTLLAQYGRLHPQVRVDLEEQVSETVVSTLREGRADVAVFVEGPDTGGLATRLFREDELVLVLPLKHPLAGKKTPIAFADTLDEEWISLTAGAAMLQQQQQAALAANRPLKLRMQVRSFDAVCHMVASGLGIAVLPKGASLPIVKTMKLGWRPLSDAWAQRRLLVATAAGDNEAAIVSLVDFLAEGAQPSQKAKAGRRNK
ncbi:MAG: LysR family transcriptional regulator [Polaromonas sp.]|uniref:LysR family transcriptional regulator n=1 Tax=Comamonadaceae TaxID=80864 RepID=UPI0027314E2B|nr:MULTISPECIES: LysR family transcriptional regulator [Comamonadaceae]MDP2442590.1 LysR family transcriptional regulator [Rhodoferax sp.]MDP3247209.1 LysR family transcriptional regulator [Polaromonas sp.]MDP3757076.1 LysR family transcriptional regulator [Polaromonas sp.]